MTDQVEPAAETMEPTAPMAVTDGSTAQTARFELSDADDAVLTCPKPRDRVIAAPRYDHSLTRGVLWGPQVNLRTSGDPRLTIAL